MRCDLAVERFCMREMNVAGEKWVECGYSGGLNYNKTHGSTEQVNLEYFN